MHTACVRPALEYVTVVWSGLSLGNVEHLERIQHRAAPLIVGEHSRSTTPHDLLLCRAGLPSRSSHLNITLYLLAHDFVLHRLPPHYMNAFPAWCPTKSDRSTSLRSYINSPIRQPKPNTSSRQDRRSMQQYDCGIRFPTIFGL